MGVGWGEREDLVSPTQPLNSFVILDKLSIPKEVSVPNLSSTMAFKANIYFIYGWFT